MAIASLHLHDERTPAVAGPRTLKRVLSSQGGRPPEAQGGRLVRIQAELRQQGTLVRPVFQGTRWGASAEGLVNLVRHGQLRTSGDFCLLVPPASNGLCER